MKNIMSLFKHTKKGALFLMSQLSEVFIFAIIYAALEIYEPGVHFEGLKCDPNDSWCSYATKFFYFSLCLQSTIGFADIKPKSEKARVLNIIQILLVYIGIFLSYDSPD